jgi:predicted Zn-dependent protease
MILQRLFSSLIVILSCGVLLLGTAYGEMASISFIRDTEIESVLYAIVHPLARAAGIDEKSIRIYLLATPEINAAASSDGRIFINAGLILKTRNVGQLRGVLAHELGHVAAHHGTRQKGLSKNLSAASLAAIFVGSGLGVTTGRADLALGVISAGTSMAGSAFCHHSRQEESAADIQAVKILKKLGYSHRGVVEFLILLRGQERLLEGEIPSYFRTHPGTQERIETLRDESTPGGHSVPDTEEQPYRRMKEKLFAFWAPLDQVMQETNQNATFSRGIALYRQGRLAEALNLLEILLARETKKNPYLLELKAQILLEKKEVPRAISVYREALSNLPAQEAAPLLQLSLAHALLEAGNPTHLEEALKILNDLTAHEKDNPQLWHLLAIGYGKKKDPGRTHLALAEEAIALGDEKRAHEEALRAQKKIPKNTPSYARVRDLLADLTLRKETSRKE